MYRKMDYVFLKFFKIYTKNKLFLCILSIYFISVHFVHFLYIDIYKSKNTFVKVFKNTPQKMDKLPVMLKKY